MRRPSTASPRNPRSPIVGLALLAGVLTGCVGGFVLQMVLAQLVRWMSAWPSGGQGWTAGAFIIVVAAVAVLVVPALRRAGAGFLLGLVLGALAQLAVFVSLFSSFT